MIKPAIPIRLPAVAGRHMAANRPKLAPGKRNPPRHSSSRPSRRSDSQTRGRRPTGRTVFHAPSFSAGVVLGAIIVLTAAYAPEFLAQSGSGKQAAAEPTPSPEVTFEFDNLLRHSRVTADPGTYQVQGETEEAGSVEYLIQAASFRQEADAESLRAQLLLQDLPATTTSTKLDNSVWYRVTVGPFENQAVAQRALTRLREQNLDALWIRRRKPT